MGNGRQSMWCCGQAGVVSAGERPGYLLVPVALLAIVLAVFLVLC